MSIYAEVTDAARRASLLALIGSLTLLAGCECSGCNDDSIAELVEERGAVERDFASSVGAWEAADVGAEFRLGDGARTGAEATAVLDLGGARLSLQPSTEIRFRREGEGAQIEVAAGLAMVEASERGSRIQTELGLAVLERGARMELGPSRLTIRLGTAVLESGSGTRTLEQGQSFDLSIGAAELEPTATRDPEPTPTVDAEPEPAPSGISVTARGDVRREEGDAWERLRAGDHVVEPGTRVRLARGARVIVRRGADTVELSGRGEHVLGAGDGALVETIGGSARLEAREGTLTVRVPGGAIIASIEEGAAEASVAVGPDGTMVRAARGRVRVQRGEESQVVAPGASAQIANPDAAVEAAAADEALGTPDLRLAAGGSLTIHDPHPPTVVRFDVDGACPTGGTVEFRRRRGLAHRFDRGRHRYDVRCEDGTVARGGRLVVLRDSGQTRLPRTPPVSVIDADGRTYTVLYQNQLPQITVRWPRGPQSGPFDLRFAQGGATAERQPRPSFAFDSGEIHEGTHRFVIEGGGRTSPETRLTIRFDNASPTASVSSPPDLGFSPGQQVQVSGVALTGWSVAVGGVEVPLDAQQRFSAQVVAPASGPLAIRLSHPDRGIHYYLRRPAGGSR